MRPRGDDDDGDNDDDDGVSDDADSDNPTENPTEVLQKSYGGRRKSYEQTLLESCRDPVAPLHKSYINLRDTL